MSKFIFTAAEDELLIENIRSHEMIYDSAHPKHKDNVFKEEHWKDISKNVCRSGKYFLLLLTDDVNNTYLLLFKLIKQDYNYSCILIIINKY